jgi:hypothetical protein
MANDERPFWTPLKWFAFGLTIALVAILAWSTLDEPGAVHNDQELDAIARNGNA